MGAPRGVPAPHTHVLHVRTALFAHPHAHLSVHTHTQPPRAHTQPPPCPWGRRSPRSPGPPTRVALRSLRARRNFKCIDP